ncbi:hypothetical protein [Paraburkholderia flava]|uniref:hypothetical protein n=1 Tax=Paraburkholderia flava TaxID=2547393 RepID=UPI00105CA677|nr:hypothetical protein [Paraburkholderia flava]
MREFVGFDIDAGELIRNLGRLEKLRTRARTIEGEDLGQPLSDNEVRVLWATGSPQPVDLPSILLGSQTTLANFLPKMLALPGAATPVTSFMKTWRIDDVTDLDVFAEKPLSNLVALGFVGLIIGELITTAGPDADLRLMGMDGVRRTLSFVCAQAVMKGWRRKSLTTLVERWLEASVLTANEVNLPARGQIADLCEFVRSLSDLRELEYFAQAPLAHHVQSWVFRQADTNQRSFLAHSLSDIAHMLEEVTSREQRYDIVMEALSHPSQELLNPLAQGFLISLIEPGSLEFLELAKSADTYGTVAIAYCLCAAILGKDNALRAFNGFGWSVLNQGLQLNADMPMDISISELQILHNSRRSAPIPFRTRSPWLIDVELAPMITGSFGNVTKRRAASQRTEEESVVAERDELLRENLATAMRALENAYGVIQGKPSSADNKVAVQRRQRR